MRLWIIALSIWISIWLTALMWTPKEVKKRKFFRKFLLSSGIATVISGLVVLFNYLFGVWSSALWALACGLVLILFGLFLWHRQRKLRPKVYD
jgi:O-antigen/teichoic acid export membrane protein